VAHERVIERLEHTLKEVRDTQVRDIGYRDGLLFQMDELNNRITASEQAIAELEAAIEALRS